MALTCTIKLTARQVSFIETALIAYIEDRKLQRFLAREEGEASFEAFFHRHVEAAKDAQNAVNTARSAWIEEDSAPALPDAPDEVARLRAALAFVWPRVPTDQRGFILDRTAHGPVIRAALGNE